MHTFVCCAASCDPRQSQRKAQIVGYFTSQLLYNQNLDFNLGDYKLEQLTLANLPSFFVFL
jgi:hypothetical protein